MGDSVRAGSLIVSVTAQGAPLEGTARRLAAESATALAERHDAARKGGGGVGLGDGEKQRATLREKHGENEAAAHAVEVEKPASCLDISNLALLLRQGFGPKGSLGIGL